MKAADFVVTIPLAIAFIVFWFWDMRRSKRRERELDVLWDKVLREERIITNPHDYYIYIGGRRNTQVHFCNNCGVEGLQKLLNTPCGGKPDKHDCNVSLASDLCALYPERQFYCKKHFQYTHNRHQCKKPTWRNYKESTQ